MIYRCKGILSKVLAGNGNTSFKLACKACAIDLVSVRSASWLSVTPYALHTSSTTSPSTASASVWTASNCPSTSSSSALSASASACSLATSWHRAAALAHLTLRTCAHALQVVPVKVEEAVLTLWDCGLFDAHDLTHHSSGTAACVPRCCRAAEP